LVKGMRVEGVKTLEEANRYLTETYLVWWDRELTVEPVNADDAHRSMNGGIDLAACLSHVEKRQIRNDYTFRIGNTHYQIDKQAVVSGLRGADVRVEKRLDGSMAVRFQERYLSFSKCGSTNAIVKPADLEGKTKEKITPSKDAVAGMPRKKWNEGFDLKKAPPIWKATSSSGNRGGGTSL
jgi:hypothetical protein